MDEILATFLQRKEANALQLSSELNKKQEDVIESLGGLTTIIELCLTNPNASKYIDTDSNKFNVLKKILKMKQDEIKNDADASTRETVCTPSDYDKFTVLIDCNRTNNLLYELIKNRDNALYLQNHILSKTPIAALALLVVIQIILAQLMNYSSLFETPSVICKIIVYSLVILYCLSFLFTANITIVGLIGNTFDFWYKVSNSIIFLVALWTMMEYFRKYSAIEFACQTTANIGALLVNICLFLLDAVPVSINIKRMAIIVYVIFAVYESIEVYFFYQEFEWNPFDSKYTQISFKSLLLSSYGNLIVFVAKPIFGDMVRYLKKNIKGKSKLSIASYKNPNIPPHDCQDDYQRCSTVYKRPYLKWKKFKSPINEAAKDNDDAKPLKPNV